MLEKLKAVEGVNRIVVNISDQAGIDIRKAPDGKWLKPVLRANGSEDPDELIATATKAKQVIGILMEGSKPEDPPTSENPPK